MLEIKWNNNSSFLISAVVLCTAIALYQILFNDWVNWDDPAYVLENKLISDLSFEGLTKMFSTLQVQGLYHPLTLISLSIDHHLVGVQSWFYHAHNLFLHLLNVVLVFKLVQLICRKPQIAAFTSLFFGIHPMHVESVAWVSERKDVLYVMYFLLGLILYISYLRQDQNKRLYYMGALICFILSLLAKAMAVTFPLILVLIDYVEKRNNFKSNWIEKVPFFLLSVFFGILAINAQQVSEAMYSIADLQWHKTVFIGSYGLLMYIIKLFVPYQLSGFHPYPDFTSGGLPWYMYASMPVVVVALYVTWSTFKKNRDVIFGMLFFLISIVPVLQILTVGKAIISERYTYLSYIGLFYILGCAWYSYTNNTVNAKYNRLVNGLLLIYLLSLILITHGRSQVWKDNVTLWSDVINKYPENHLAYCNRASSYVDLNYLPQALSDCDACISLKPDMYESYNNRGLVHLKMSNFELALQDFNRAISLNEYYMTALSNRAAVLMNTGKDQLAKADLLILKRKEPYNSLVYYNMAVIMARSGKLDSAYKEINTALTLDSNQAQYYMLRSKISMHLNQSETAIEDLNAAIILGYNINEADADSLRQVIRASSTLNNSH